MTEIQTHNMTIEQTDGSIIHNDSYTNRYYDDIINEIIYCITDTDIDRNNDRDGSSSTSNSSVEENFTEHPYVSYIEQDENIETVLEALDEIADHEESIPYVDCVENKYYIGCYSYYDENLLFAMRIDLSTFYKFKQNDINHYMFYCSELPLNCSVTKNNLQIMKLVITEDDVYIAVLKTFWIRIIQRTWKRIYRERKEIVQNWLKKYSRDFSHGKGPKIPRLYGNL